MCKDKKLVNDVYDPSIEDKEQHETTSTRCGFEFAVPRFTIRFFGSRQTTHDSKMKEQRDKLDTIEYKANN